MCCVHGVIESLTEHVQIYTWANVSIASCSGSRALLFVVRYGCKVVHNVC
jgi:hypothetical protein